MKTTTWHVITAVADSGKAVVENKPGAWTCDEERDTDVNWALVNYKRVMVPLEKGNLALTWPDDQN